MLFLDDFRYWSEFCLHHSFSAAVFLRSSDNDFLDIRLLVLFVDWWCVRLSSLLLSLLECVLLVSSRMSRLMKLTDVLRSFVPLEVVGIDVAA